MQILSTLALCRRVGSILPRCWWSKALARRHTQLVASASVHPNQHQHMNSFPRPWCMQPHLRIRRVCSSTKCMDTPMVTKEAIDNFTPTLVGHRYANGVWYPYIYRNSSHRDGAIYQNARLQDDFYECDITDRGETCLEPMMFSEAMERCKYVGHCCLLHPPSHMLQVFSVTVAQSTISNGSIQLYGYIAVRDMQDGMLNYVLNHSRDDPITLQQGSFIEMTGPKRGIYMGDDVLMEFDMRIINGEHEDCDLQLIDGAMAIANLRPWKPIKHRIVGNCGAVDISLAYVEHGVEATIEVAIFEVQRDFSLSLSSLIYLMENYEEIPIFHGTISQEIILRRFVVAVTLGTEMQLKFKLGNDNFVWSCTSTAVAHGSDYKEIKLDLGSISVKVTWSSI